ncbi:MAG: hypothetical protein HC929_06750 [Leptolyngbyaceae cyanobacterium SM2_5_2]|nr:hypothetical protein [Leptolyngbyaceae cyanobacterium SM2_5_2]
MTELFDPIPDSEQLLRWWHQHQTQWLASEADAVRNGLLQDLFAVRRQLELMAGDDIHTLATVEHLYDALENLGDRLSSPYGQESLPLAMQHALKGWPSELALEARLPNRWPVEPIEYVTLVLSVLEHLRETLVALPNLPQACTVELAERQEHKQLTVQLNLQTLPSTLEGCNSADWAYHLSTFESITGGQARCTHTDHAVLWQLTW